MKNKAFTLIELLVGIAIIGILATVVIASLNGARDRAKTAAIKSEARQLFSLAMAHYAETGNAETFFTSYGWVRGDSQGGAGGTACSTRIGVNALNREKAIEICNSITSKLPTNTSSGSNSNKMLTSCNGGTCTDRKSQFSIQVKLQDNESVSGAGAGPYFCIGTSGATSEGTYNTSRAGCYANP